MNDHGSSNYIAQTKTIGQHCHKSPSIAGIEIGQISCVLRVGLPFGIVICACHFKFCAIATTAFVNMDSKETGFGLRLSANLCNYQQALFHLVKPNVSTQIGYLCAC